MKWNQCDAFRKKWSHKFYVEGLPINCLKLWSEIFFVIFVVQLMLKRMKDNQVRFARIKGALPRYLATLQKARRCLRISWIPKLMTLWFCYLRLFEGAETVSCRLALRMAWMEMGWNLKKLANFVKFWYYVFKNSLNYFSGAFGFLGSSV